MNTRKIRSFLSGIPSWGLAGLTFVASIILFFGLGDLGGSMKIDDEIGEPILYIIYGLFIAVCCFFIIRQNPKSIWYVPIICNALGILAAVTGPHFRETSMWIFICSGWMLSIIASIIGFIIGRKSAVVGVNAA
jgi:hypothetical protein